MRRTLQILTAGLWLIVFGSALSRGQEADLLPALLALDPPQIIATTGRTPASPAPVTVGPLEPTVQASTSAPPAAGSIHWVTPAEAAASPLPDYWCVTIEDGSCPPCNRLKTLLADPRVIAWSRHYDCVKSDRLDGKLPKGYPVQRWGKRVREGVLPGYGVNELMWDFAGEKPAKPVKVAAVRQGYRSRAGNHWSYPGNIHAHLISEHGGGIDPAWIRSLSTNEARTLHDDLHTGRADWSRIVTR